MSKKDKPNNKVAVSRSPSIDLLDSRAEQEREAKTPEERARRAVERAFLHSTNKQVFEHALKYVAAEIREAVEVDRQRRKEMAQKVRIEKINSSNFRK